MSCRLVGEHPIFDKKYQLPILTKGDLFTTIGYAGAWAYSTFGHMSPDARNLLTSGAMTCVIYGLCGFVGLEKDGDWREEATARSEFTQLPPEDTYSSPELILTALEVIVATKANWWTKNCLTGPGIMIGHVKKYAYKDFTQAAHIMGHWASTINILSVAGVKGLRTFKAVGLPGEQKLTLSRDAKFMFNLLPAGTRGLAVAHAAVLRLLDSPFAGIRSPVKDMMVIPKVYAIIKETPASYHIEAKYLTGKPKEDYNDVKYLGMLQAYFNSIISKAHDYADYALRLAKALASVGADPKESLRNLLGRIEETIQELQNAFGVPSALGKSNKKDVEVEKGLINQIARIDKAVQELQNSLGIRSAVGGHEAEALGNLFESNAQTVQNVEDAFMVPSAAGKRKRKRKGDDNSAAGERKRKRKGDDNSAAGERKRKRKSDDRGRSVSAAKRAAIESLEPKATTSSHC